jgi:glycosyltransferase involved in cell wall biosynthesis
MRVLIALTYYRPHYSGLTIYAERVARALVSRGHRVTILTSRYDNKLPAHEIQNGVKVIRPAVWFHISKGVIMPGILYWAWKEIRKTDVVQLHVPQLDAAPISMISRLLGKPIVLSYHCDLLLPKGVVHSIANRVSDTANNITARNASVIVHNTRDYAEHSAYLRKYIDKVHPIPPPIEVPSITQADIQAFRNKFKLLPDERIIGMAARLASEKGVEYLARALPLLLKQHPHARVLFVGPYQNVVGEEAYAERLTSLIEPLGEHWSFLGILSPVEMAAFFHECEVTVLPSINSTESYGMVQIESMSCGTPVVTTDLPGVRVPVEMTRMGQVVPPADPDELARALIEILDEPDKYGGQPDVIIQPSTPDNVAAEYEKIFDQLVQHSPRGKL